MTKKLLLALGVTASSVVLAGCINQPVSTPEPAADTTTETRMTGTPEAENADAADNIPNENSAEKKMAAKEMTIDMFMFGYSEGKIMAKPGETITINLTNSEGLHDFVIDELKVASEKIKADETTSVTFTIPADAEPGTEYEYYCSIGNHRAEGMVGKLIVQ